MAQIPISNPFIRQEGPSSMSPTVQKDVLPEAASQTWIRRALVQVTGTGASAALQVVPSAATAIYGQSPDAAYGSATATNLLKPPNTLFGLNHYAFDLRDRILEINITDSSSSGANIGANGVTYAGGGTNGVALAPGQQYGVLLIATGVNAGYHTLNVQNTTQKVFEVVGLPPGANGLVAAQTTTDNNPRVLVKVIASVIQG